MYTTKWVWEILKEILKVCASTSVLVKLWVCGCTGHVFTFVCMKTFNLNPVFQKYLDTLYLDFRSIRL